MSSSDYYSAMSEVDIPGLRAAAKSRSLDLYSYLMVLHANDCREGAKSAYPDVGLSTHKVSVHQKSGTSRYSRNMITDAGAAVTAMKQLGLTGASAALPFDLLLRGAVLLEFDFTLEKQYLSRDDTPFYPIDNPVRKEFVFKTPMVSGSSWKGNLRSAAVENMLTRNTSPDQKRQERYSLIDVFGDEKGNGDEPSTHPDRALGQFLNDYFGFCPLGRRRGRLRCLPSYFDRIDLDVLNPRDRETRAGTQPIVFEVVPPGATARFGLFYFPFDLLGHSDSKRTAAVREDWRLIGEAVHQMLRVSGFGAKKSSGCGKARSAIANARFEAEDWAGSALTDLNQLIHLAEGFKVSS